MEFDFMQLASIFVVLIILMILSSAIKIVKEFERGVILRLGRLKGAKGPGIFFIIPMIDRMYKVDLRTKVLDVPVQEVMTRDNVPVRVNAVVYLRVMDASKSIIQVQNFIAATSQISQTTLRSIIGQAHLDELLSERDKLNRDLQKIIDEATDPWGIKVSAVEIKDVELPSTMKRAMAAQAEAERDRRAKIINAQGELQAAEKLTEAAKLMATEPMTIQLRLLQTISEVSTENASTIILPFPIEFLKLLELKKK
ncbi:MAG: slipin family protein [Methanomicrobia archaeon]|nr:slipin family protein [Methanomicrobia archaeon]RLF95005.1 MAG: slipin family protein [Thermococci archaeon]RLF95626.1 MAG: slipin family protein [Thermococci archaeon]HEC95539.1 slipin family protein [Euryarchaeota archaeon]